AACACASSANAARLRPSCRRACSAPSTAPRATGACSWALPPTTAAAGTWPRHAGGWPRAYATGNWTRRPSTSTCWARNWRCTACRSRTCSCAPAANSASATSCCGNLHTASCGSRISCGRTWTGRRWIAHWPIMAGASGASAAPPRRWQPAQTTHEALFVKQRIVTALVLTPLAIAAVLLLPSPLFVALVAALLLVGLWEWTRLAGFDGHPRRLVLVALHAALMALLARFGWPHLFAPIALVGVAWWLLSLLWLSRFQLGADLSRKRNRWPKLLAGTLAVVPAWCA